MENERDSAQSLRANCPQVLKKTPILGRFKEKRKKKIGPEEKSSEQQDRGKMGIYWSPEFLPDHSWCVLRRKSRTRSPQLPRVDLA